VESLSEYPFQDGYSTSSQSLLNDFYEPALDRSENYFRAAGYFSSSLFALAPLAYANFVSRGGKMKLLCSPHLSTADAEFFSNLPDEDEPETQDIVEASLRSLCEAGNVEAALAKVLSSLIASGILEVQFVVYQNGNLFHDKVGIFSDSQGNITSFLGSANETLAAWSGRNNHEQIEVFCSWHSDESRRRAVRHADQFEETWFGLRRGLKIIPAKESASYIQRVVAPEPIESTLEEVKQALKKATTKAAVGTKELRTYQTDVLRNWAAHSSRGVVSFATGGGKTLTAIHAIREWINKGRPALVLVPSELLHTQWASELQQELGTEIPILRIGAGASRKNWLENLRGYSSDDEEIGPRIILSTYQSAATESFLSRISDGPHLLLVGDEVHRIGAPDTRKVMERIDAGARLGLSATPDRYGDPEGTQAIFDYFGKVLEPRFTLDDAIRQKVLVEYDYQLEVCQLTEDEQFAWDKLSKMIGQDYVKNNLELSDYGRHLLRQRAIVGKRAHGKAGIARGILAAHAAPDDRWLVYCNDRKHLQEVANSIKDLNLQVMEYHSENSEHHKATLDYFTDRGGVLLAIKCLDEGIDIPVINKAIILASSTNPREYIQRRGRVLRRAQGKFSAQIYDVAVVDDEGLPLTPSEVIRAEEFAQGARNKASTLELEMMKSAMSVAANKLKDRTDFEDDDENPTGTEGE
jgi:superfamily II DNA or RNA helicase